VNSTQHRPLVQAHDLAKTFDVSAPWLNRVLEASPARCCTPSTV
jgi:peptide/nickel transport system ATP-binding protein